MADLSRSAILSEYAADLHQEVLAKLSTDSGGPNSAGHPLRAELFTELVLDMLGEHNEVAGWEICGYEAKHAGSVPGARLSALAISGDGATVDLFVSLYHGTGLVEEVGKPEMRRQFELLLGFLKRSLSGCHTRMEEASDAFDAARRIHEARDSLATVRLFLLTDGILRTLELVEEAVEGLEIRYVAWDLEKLSRLHVGDRGTIELDLLRDYGGSIACLEASGQAAEYRTFLTFFPAPLLARIYGEYGQRLLERNVRAFLQSKGKINRGLHATLKEEPERFLAYNNGLCCTAASVELTETPGGAASIASISDFQVVNGGQTTASIFHALKKDNLDLSRVRVQVKLTVLSDSDRAAEIVPLISRYANSQNKVNGADFAANGEFHRRLEELSRTVWAPAISGMERGSHWYYERARGSYLDDKNRQGSLASRREWVVQNPLRQKFTKTDLAKYEHAWLGLPHLVCRGAEKNFQAFAGRLEEDGAPTVDRAFFEQVVARTILWRQTEKIFDSLGLAGYRANSVAYAVAWLAEQSGRRLDLAAIWRDQSVSQPVADSLLVACRSAHEFLLSKPGNAGEASKRSETWVEFRSAELAAAGEWQNGDANAAYPSVRPRPEAVAARQSIASVSADDWFTMAKWSKDRGLLQGWERGLVFSLGKLVTRRALPSDKQAIQGARILARAIELGFSLEGSPPEP